MKKYLGIGLILAVSSMAPLRAQIVCTGPGCQYLPLSQATLDQMFYDFKTKYTDQLFKDMAAAGVLANITGAPTGTVNLYGWTIGASAGLGYIPVKEVSIPITGYGELKDIPRAGGAVNPRIFFGANVGWLLNQAYDPWGDGESSEPFFLSLSRFDLYGSFIQDRRHYALQDSGQVTVNTRNLGFDVRYHLVEGKPLAAGPLLRFLGVSVGAGYHSAAMDITAVQTQNQKMKITLTGGSNLIWDGANQGKIQTQVKSMPFEVMTGLQILYALNMSFGGGMSMNKGSADVTLTRLGPVYVSNDAAALLAAATGQTVASSAYNSYLTMQVTGSGQAPRNMAYAKLGLDFNILWFKVFAEGVWAKRAYGANLGVRWQM